MSRKKLIPILPKPVGRRPVPVDMSAVRDLCRRGASNRQVQETLKLSYGTASRRCMEARESLVAAGIEILAAQPDGEIMQHSRGG